MFIHTNTLQTLKRYPSFKTHQSSAKRYAATVCWVSAWWHHLFFDTYLVYLVVLLSRWL